jgi:hypothetical protein
MSHLPVAEADVVATGKRAGFFQDWLGASEPVHPYWGAERQHRERIGEITAPTLLFAAWQDILLPGQLADYAAMRAVGRTPYLTIGPWLHVDTEVMAEATREALVWFRAHVTGDTSTLRAQPVRLYVQGADEWRDYPDWPPAGFTDETWYLQPHNRLALQPPQDGVTGRFTYDPADPTPTVGGPLLDPRTGGRKDNAGLEARPDVLVYTSDPLTEPVEVIGPVSALIRLHISAEHADVVVRLCDVDPDGRSTNVCDGIQRTTPEEADGTVVHLWPTAYRFDRGHRLRVQVCGGSFPRFPRGTADPHATQLHAVDYEILDGSHIVLKRSEFLQREVSMWGRLVRRLGMTDTMSEPISTTNLDRYGHAELPWSRPRDILVTDPGKSHLTFFVGTVRPDGRPHSAGVGAIWVDDALYFVGGPETRRSRNLAANPACTVSATLRGIDLVLEGDAHRVTDVSTLEQIAAVYRTSGWPAEVEGAAFTAPFSAPSAGPAPWYLYRLTLHTAFGVANAEPHGATRWDFAH